MSGEEAIWATLEEETDNLEEDTDNLEEETDNLEDDSKAAEGGVTATDTAELLLESALERGRRWGPAERASDSFSAFSRAASILLSSSVSSSSCSFAF